MKKLNVKAVVIDLRHVSEETLASYEHIQIHAALAMTSPRTEALLAKYPVELDATSVQCYDDDAKVNMVNGKTELTASHKPEGKSVLIEICRPLRSRALASSPPDVGSTSTLTPIR